VECFAGDERLHELAHREVLLLCALHDVGREGFVRKAEGSSQRILDQCFRETACEVLGLGGDEVAQLEVVFESGAFVEGGGRVDGPGLEAVPRGAAVSVEGMEAVFGAPFAGGVEVF